MQLPRFTLQNSWYFNIFILSFNTCLLFFLDTWRIFSRVRWHSEFQDLLSGRNDQGWSLVEYYISQLECLLIRVPFLNILDVSRERQWGWQFFWAVKSNVHLGSDKENYTWQNPQASIHHSKLHLQQLPPQLFSGTSSGPACGHQPDPHEMQQTGLQMCCWISTLSAYKEQTPSKD